MLVLFNMEKLFDVFMFFKRKNFTVTREFKMGENVHIWEYTYNMSRYLTDVWPPNTSSSSGFPIKSVIREDDGSDVTENVLKFSGPRKNYVNPVSLFKKRGRKLVVKCIGWGKFRLEFVDTWEPYYGNVIVSDVFGFKKIIPLYSNGGVAHISP